MRLLTCLFTVLLLVVAAKAIRAEQAAPQMSKPETPQPETPQPSNDSQQPAGQQQPGAGAQVHTGTSSGLDTDTRLENLLADHQFIRIEGELDQLPARQAQAVFQPLIFPFYSLLRAAHLATPARLPQSPPAKR